MRSMYEQWIPVALSRISRLEHCRVVRLCPGNGTRPIDLLAEGWEDIRVINRVFLDNASLRRLPTPVRLTRAPLVVDVGANRGYFSVQACTALDRPQVVAVEPEPGNLAMLRANLALNSLADAVDVVAAAAVSDARDEVTLHLSSTPAYHTTIGPTDSARHGWGQERYVGRSLNARAVNLDAELRRRLEVAPAIDILKVDTEGTELALLASLSDDVLASIRYIVTEYFPVAGDDRVLERLERAGFNVDVSHHRLYASREV
jgi:FkbM family methyltransferase